MLAVSPSGSFMGCVGLDHLRSGILAPKKGCNDSLSSLLFSNNSFNHNPTFRASASGERDATRAEAPRDAGAWVNRQLELSPVMQEIRRTGDH